jgi:hypothetical protein
MKPYLLALILALPLMVYNVLTCESVDATDSTPATKTETAVPAGNASRAVAPARTPSASKPASNSRLPAHTKAWFM